MAETTSHRGFRIPSPIRRLLDVIITLAYLVMAAWFAWLLVDEDGIPFAFAIASLVAAVIVVIDAGSRLLTGNDRDSLE
jgi:NhaP-type Na+/H+ or K+/H+ antiporter